MIVATMKIINYISDHESDILTLRDQIVYQRIFMPSIYR